MSPAPVRAPGLSDPGLSFRPFVLLIAAMMAVNALGIDSMLAALPQIGASLGIVHENDRQWIIAAYVFGFGAAQLVYGPMADRYGRRPVLLVSMSLFAVMSVAAGFATDFRSIVAVRVAQGMAAAAARVLTVSIVRDCYQGRQMARVMSLSFIIFLLVPILAPSLGQAILLVGSWRDIFFVLAGFGALLAILAGVFLNETLHPANRRPANPREVAGAIRAVLGDRMSAGYMVATTLTFGALMGFINSVQQIFADEFHAAARFPLVFAGVAGSMGVAGYLNSRLVERHGTRRISHMALIGFMGVAALHALVAWSARETLVSFAVLQCAQMFCFGLMGSNFGSMAMERMGHIAGTAASVQGFVSTLGGAAIGIVIGQAFDGTSLPMTLGFLIDGLLVLLAVLWTEHGRLFRPQHALAPARAGVA